MLKKEASPKPTAPYVGTIRPTTLSALHRRIVAELRLDGHYRDPHYRVADVVRALGTNRRYVAAALAASSDGNWSRLVARLRIEHAERLVRSGRYDRLNLEEIGLLSGFTTRQTFHTAMRSLRGLTPMQWRAGI